MPSSATPAGGGTAARSDGTVAGTVAAGSGSGAVVATDWRFEGAVVESRALPEPHAVVTATTRATPATMPAPRRSAHAFRGGTARSLADPEPVHRTLGERGADRLGHQRPDDVRTVVVEVRAVGTDRRIGPAARAQRGVEIQQLETMSRAPPAARRRRPRRCATGRGATAGVDPPPTTSFVPKHGGRIATIDAPVALDRVEERRDVARVAGGPPGIAGSGHAVRDRPRRTGPTRRLGRRPRRA